VKEQLEEHGKAMIVDCHSFPSKPFIRDLDQSTNRPDFNIGTDPFHTPKELIELSKEFFQQRGYSLGIDWPYSGSLVPMSHYHRTKEVQSIMLEVNRALYLDEPSNDKSGGYADTKETVREYLEVVEDYIL
jgi:N-formylglutamate amidohydrolase